MTLGSFPAYYNREEITVAKRFVVQAPEISKTMHTLVLGLPKVPWTATLALLALAYLGDETTNIFAVVP